MLRTDSLLLLLCLGGVVLCLDGGELLAFRCGFTRTSFSLEKVTSIYSPYKVTSSSSFVSRSTPYNHPPEWSVEGTSTRINSCFVSKIEANPWWTLDLDSSREIKNIQVVTPSSLRTGVNLANFDRLAMYVSNSSSISGNKSQCGATYNYPINGSLPESVPFECGSLTGRYIHATVDPSGSNGQLILCEVIVNVANGKY